MIEPLDFAIIKIEIILPAAPVFVAPPGVVAPLSPGLITEVVKPITNVLKPGVIKNPRSATKVLPPQVKLSRKDAAKNKIPSPPHRILKDPSSGKSKPSINFIITHTILFYFRSHFNL